MAARAKLELHLLGKARLVYDGRLLTETLPVKAQALLYYLAVTGQVHTRHALAGLLWGDRPEENAKNSLRVALAALRRLFPDCLLPTYQTVAFNQACDYWLDTDAFDRLPDAGQVVRAAAGRPQPARQEEAPADQSVALQWVALYRGDFLEDFFVEEAPAFEAWLLGQRAYWQQRALRAMEHLSDRLLERRRYGEAVALLQRWLAIEPWQEEAHRRLMLAYGRRGDFGAALSQYERCRRLLQEELNVEPMAETRQLYERLQLARRSRPRHLPAAGVPLVGREEELRQLGQLLTSPACRLLTITGLGGAGKTHLALAAARQADQEQAVEFLNGVLFVPLQGVQSSDDLSQAMAAAMNVPLSGHSGSPAGVVDLLRHKEMLLVLDNFEHLLEGAGLLSQILDACPGIKFLVTSRQPLRLSVEWRFECGGLPFPAGGVPAALAPPAEAAAFPAVQLFIQSAKQLRPAYEPSAGELSHIVRLCRLVEGMPLAIRLAAAWLRVMTAEEIALEVERNLDILSSGMWDVPPRQQSIRAVLEQSWARLASQERRVVAALSVFGGGFTAEAARRVAGATPLLLAGLVEQGMVQPAPAGSGYRLHELVRHYAAEKRAVGPAASLAVEGAHARYYADLVRQQEAGLRGQGQKEAYRLLRQERENICQAWRWAVAHRQEELVAALVESLYEFYLSQSWFIQGERLFEEAVSALCRPPLRPLSLRLLAGRAEFLRRLGRYAEAEACLRRCREDADRLEAPHLTVRAADGLAHVAYDRGVYGQAYRWAEEALALYEKAGDGRGAGRMLALLGRLLGIEARYAEAAAALERGLALYQAAGDRLSQVPLLRFLGTDALDVGRFDEAEAYYLQALDLLEQLGLQQGGNILLNNLGSVAWARGDGKSAGRYYHECLLISREVGDRAGEALALAGLSLVARGAGKAAEALRLAQQSLGLSRALGAQNRIAWGLKVVAEAERDLGNLMAARQKLEESLAIYRETGHQDSIVHLLSLLAGVAQEMGDDATAGQYAYEGLGLAAAMKSEAAAVDALANVADCLIRQERRRQAGRLLLFIRQHPAAHRSVQARAAALLAEIEPALSSAELALWRQEASALRLWQAVEALLVEGGENSP